MGSAALCPKVALLNNGLLLAALSRIMIADKRAFVSGFKLLTKMSRQISRPPDIDSGAGDAFRISAEEQPGPRSIQKQFTGQPVLSGQSCA
jgi:hypothetical protein